MSESEQDRRETLADIVAEMRTRSREVKEAFGGRPDGVENMLDIWADRIEAAAKRVVVSKTETTTVGNAAAMRDALVRCDAIAQLPEVRNEQSIKDMRNIIKHALSAPARNCDLCDSYGDAIRAFEDTEDAEEYEDMAEWLLAPAERKGEDYGK